MARKTISLRVETYHRLNRVKAEGENFSDVIDRLLEAEDQPLHGLIGLLDEDELSALRKQSAAFRESADNRSVSDSCG